MRSTIGDRHRRAARARLPARPRRRALGAAAPPLRPVAGPSSAGPTAALVVEFVARRPLIARPRPRAAGRLARADLERARDRCASGSSTSPARRRGMDVTWRIEATPDRLPRHDRARLPAADARVRGLRRSLVHAADRRADAGHVQGARRGGGDRGGGSGAARRSPIAAPGDESTDMSDRRRVWITGIGVITPIGTGVDAFRAGPPRRPLAGQADRPLRSEPVPLPGRRPGRRLRPARLDAAEDGPAARPVQPVRARRRAPGARRRAARPRARTAPPRPSGSGSTSARRSAGSPTPRTSTRATWSAASARWPRTSRWPCSAARRRPTSGSRSTSAARSCRRRTRAPRARSRSARRSATCAKAGSMPRSPAAARSR